MTWVCHFCSQRKSNNGYVLSFVGNNTEKGGGGELVLSN